MIARPAKKMRLSDVPVKYVWLNCKSTPPPSPVRQESGTKSSHVFGPIVILRLCEWKCLEKSLCLSASTLCVTVDPFSYLISRPAAHITALHIIIIPDFARASIDQEMIPVPIHPVT